MSNALLNVSVHYDISNEMFAAFLSTGMTYSCPIWLPKSQNKSTEEPLEDVQDRKLLKFVKNACMKPTDHVLEIGTGWGEFCDHGSEENGLPSDFPYFKSRTRLETNC